MNQIPAFIQKLQLRKTLATLFIGLMFLVGISIGQLVYPASANAASTPEAQSYQLDRGNPHLNSGANQARAGEDGGLINSIQEGAENVKEKLNLDEPLPESTKLFFKQLKGEDVQVKEPKPLGKGQEPQNQ